MRAKHLALALLLVMVAGMVSACGGARQMTPSTPPIDTNAPIGGMESGSSGSSSSSSGASAPATSASTASNAAQLGQQIFTTGNAADGTTIAVTQGSGGPCARCHGADATGQVGPDIRWSVLTGASGSQRPPRYPISSEADFLTAVTTGVVAGNQLRPMMPHYQLTDAQAAALVAYLKSL